MLEMFTTFYHSVFDIMMDIVVVLSFAVHFFHILDSHIYLSFLIVNLIFPKKSQLFSFVLQKTREESNKELITDINPQAICFVKYSRYILTFFKLHLSFFSKYYGKKLSLSGYNLVNILYLIL